MKGLLYLHDKNIVHRDLKPENVLLSGKKRIETAKIWDFGLAKILEPGIDGLISELCGTLLYKAPEQILGTLYSKVNFFFLISILGCRHLGLRFYNVWNAKSSKTHCGWAYDEIKKNISASLSTEKTKIFLPSQQNLRQRKIFS